MGHPPNIVLTDQTNEHKFPRWAANAAPGQSGYAYPKMLVKPCTKADREEWTEKNRRLDQNTRQEYWEERPPKVGSPIPIVVTQDLVDSGFAEIVGQPVIVRDPTEEERVLEILGLEELGQQSGAATIPIAAQGARARSQSSLEDEIADLRRQLKTKPKVARGWPKGKPRKAKTDTAAIEDAEVADVSEE